MQRIVVNRCYGGFGLSLKAQEEYLKSRGKEAYFYITSKYKHRDGVEEHKKFDPDKDEMPLSVHVSTKDFGETFEKFGKEQNGSYFSDSDIKRDDPKLVEIVN